MKEITGNLLDITHGILCHQVNCVGIMGHGIANQIGNKWPAIREQYREYGGKLGEVYFHQVAPGLIVANLFGQNGIAHGKRKTHYGALAQCLVTVQKRAWDLQLPVYFPWKMSSDLAGGDWVIVSELIDFLIGNPTIVKLQRYDRVTGMPA